MIVIGKDVPGVCDRVVSAADGCADDIALAVLDWLSLGQFVFPIITLIVNSRVAHDLNRGVGNRSVFQSPNAVYDSLYAFLGWLAHRFCLVLVCCGVAWGYTTAQISVSLPAVRQYRVALP